MVCDLFPSTWSMCLVQAWEQKACHWLLWCQCLLQTKGQCVFDHARYTLPACLQSEACPSDMQLPGAPGGSLVALPPHRAQHANKTFYGSEETQTQLEFHYGLALISSRVIYSRNPGIVTVGKPVTWPKHNPCLSYSCIMTSASHLCRMGCWNYKVRGGSPPDKSIMKDFLIWLKKSVEYDIQFDTTIKKLRLFHALLKYVVVHKRHNTHIILNVHPH